jgi:hypothetical protein
MGWHHADAARLNNGLLLEIGTVVAFILVVFFFLQTSRIRGVFADIVVFVLFCSPLFLALILRVNLGEFGFTFNRQSVLLSLLIGVPFGLSYFFIQYYLLHLRTLMSSEMVKLLFPRTRLNAARRVLESEFLSPVGEGILYRGFILGFLVQLVGVVGVALSSIPFFVQLRAEPAWAAHVRTVRSRIFTLYVIITLGLTVYFSGSLVGSMVSHGVSNLPFSIITVRQSLRSRHSTLPQDKQPIAGTTNGRAHYYGMEDQISLGKRESNLL